MQEFQSESIRTRVCHLKTEVIDKEQLLPRGYQLFDPAVIAVLILIVAVWPDDNTAIAFHACVGEPVGDIFEYGDVSQILQRHTGHQVRVCVDFVAVFKGTGVI